MHKCWNSMQNSVFAEVITSYLVVIAKLASMDNSIGLVPRRLGTRAGKGYSCPRCTSGRIDRHRDSRPLMQWLFEDG